MPDFKIFKETTLPGTLEANSIYVIAPASKPDFVEIYVTGTSAGTVKRLITGDDVEAMITNALSMSGSLEIVQDIAERDALTLSANAMILVIDASADLDVGVGSATYAYRQSDLTFIKVAEHESMDVVLDWSSIQNAPSSTVSEIDAAVAATHSHANKTELDAISEDANGNMIYNGASLVIGWNSTGW